MLVIRIWIPQLNFYSKGLELGKNNFVMLWRKRKVDKRVLITKKYRGSW